ncbi:MAG TPA: phage holin family protein [Solirubrobacteraceae bacterium]|nr:phage holin family protein [Solirubrobacteraceae bacterium]
MAADPRNSGDGSPQIAAAVQEISERATLLVREEIELAKAEVAEKVNKLVRGAVVGTAAGVFAIFGLSVLLHGLAWLLFALVFDDIYWGFFVVAGLLFLFAGLAAFLAVRWFKGGAPPTPDMAIDEAQRIRATLTGEPGGQIEAVAARHEAEKE